MHACHQRIKDIEVCVIICVIVRILCADDIQTVNLESFDVSVIANMVKRYLRELPEPVIPEDSYSNFVDAASMYSAKCQLPLQ